MDVFRVYWKDTLVAEQRGESINAIVAELVPYTLFCGATSVTIFELYKWLSTRVFQESRLDLPELLASLDLEEYNVWDIARKTRAILTGVDFYSVEWVDEGTGETL